jgi:hypothetical protein
MTEAFMQETKQNIREQVNKEAFSAKCKIERTVNTIAENIVSVVRNTKYHFEE